MSRHYVLSPGDLIFPMCYSTVFHEGSGVVKGTVPDLRTEQSCVVESGLSPEVIVNQRERPLLISFTNPHVIKLGLRHAQTRFDIPQTLPVGQLRKGHTQKLIPTRKTFHLVIALVPFHTLAKLVRGDKVHQLSKNDSPDIHRPSPFSVMRKYGQWKKIISNTKMSSLDKNPCLPIG